MAFKTFDRKGVAFSVGSLKAGYEFSTESSISFQLWVDGSLGEKLGAGKAFSALNSYPVRLMKGHIDVHYPCKEHVKLRVRVILSKSIFENDDLKARKSFLDKIFEVLEIATDETYEIVFIEESSGLILGNHTDRHGMSDGI